ncbi:MAG TPA: nucleotide pyrophosphohydrolase [Tepidisphaeraceae bacterium]|jgi:NTP pyrophosphatase (non-canonical NTP hydrolase)
MNDAKLNELTQLVLHFREERDWKQFHNPKDQAVSLCLEAAELLELMQWRNGRELEEHLNAIKERMGEELADVLGWVLLLAHDQGIDLGKAFERKIRINTEKYPVEKAKGVATKYTDL